MKLADLKPASWNPRTITKEAASGLSASLTRFGLVDPLIVNKRTGYTIVGGHQRYAVMQQQGIKESQVVLLDISEAEERALNVTLNNPHIAGDWSDELVSLLDQIRSDGVVDFEALGLNKLLDEITIPLKEGATDPDDIPSAPDKATSRRGQVWILGNHRLMCGDSSNAEDVKRLLAGTKIHLVNTDPPYNVRVEPRSNNAIAAGNSSFDNKSQRLTKSTGLQMHHQSFDAARRPSVKKATHRQMRPKDRVLLNDFMKPADFDKILRLWFRNMADALIPGRGFYIWGGYANCANYPSAMAECELYFSQSIIWVKRHAVLTRKDFMGNHEWCFYGWRDDPKNLVISQGGFTRDHRYAFYGWKEGAAHYFDPATFNATDVWEVKKVTPQMMVHLTEKPVELAIRAMQYSSRPRENVLDLFGGSGSTLIAAEQAGRQAFLMEQDDLYCDVIRMRWENFTGKKAVLEKI